MSELVGGLLIILLIGLTLQRLQQPYVVGYLLGGILLGPHGLELVTDETVLSRLGSLGVVLLLFFIGMEASPKKLIGRWKISVIGTLFQILISVGVVWLIGMWLDWPLHRIILIGFVISLSSTAVVLKILQDWKEMDSPIGQDVLGILLMQDLAVIPMLIIIGNMGGDSIETAAIIKQIIGTVLMFVLIAWIFMHDHISLPFLQKIRDDHEMQIFLALTICFGLALVTALFGLSTALGAFVAGMLVAAARETQWIHHSLNPFRVVFIALFFVSIGMLVDLTFLKSEWILVTMLTLAVLLTNTFINAAILRSLGDSWRNSLYAGALLSQIGEFSFVLAAVGVQAGIVTGYGHAMTIAVIALSLLLSPAWIAIIKKLLKMQHTL